MKITTLVQASDGTYVRKSRPELGPTDMVVFDGPDTQAALERAQARLDAEMAAAGGLEKGQAASPPVKGRSIG